MTGSREDEGVSAGSRPAEAGGGWFQRGLVRGAALWNRGGILRFLVSAVLFALLIWKMNAAALFRDWRDIVPGHFALAVVLLAASNFVNCLQWFVLLRAQGLRPGAGLVISSFHVGLFFGNFLPGHYGGDAVRVFDVYRATGEGYRVLAATFLDRLLGLVSLCLLALAVAPAFLGESERGALGALAFTSAALFAVMVLLFSRRAGRLLRFIVRPLDSVGLRSRLRSGYDAVHLYRDHGGAMALALAISLIVQALRILVHYETALAIGVRTELRNFFLLVPLVAIFIALPISLNGIGVREGSGMVLFSRVGVSKEGAFSLLFLAYLAGVLVSLAGGVLFALRGRAGRSLGEAPRPPGAPADPRRV